MHRVLLLLLSVSVLLITVRADVEAGSMSSGSGSTDTTTPPPPTPTPPTSSPVTTPPITTKPPTKSPPPPSDDGSGTPEVTTPAPTTETPTPTTPTPTTPLPTTLLPDSGSGSGSVDGGGFNSSSNKNDVPKNNQSPPDSGGGGSSAKYAIIVAVAIVAGVVLLALIFVRRRLQRKKEESDKELQSELDRLDLERGGAAYTVTGTPFPHQIQSRSLDPNNQRPSDVRGSGSGSGSGSGPGSGPYFSKPASTSWSSSWTTAVGSVGLGGGSERDSLSAIWKDPDILAARIPFEKLVFRTVVTRGGFGEVLEGVYHGQRVAIKRLLPENRRRMACLEEFLKEAQLLSALDHERIVQFVGVAWDSPRDLCLVVEFMAHGDLRSTLARWRQEGRKTGWLDVRKVRIALHVAEALTYLHSLSPRILHRDLKSRNVLLDAHWRAKLSDFGASREQPSGSGSGSGSGRTMTSSVGSSLWIAPEVLLGSRYDEKADVFSFGVVLAELDAMQLPYHSAVSPDGRKLPDAAVLHLVAMGKLQAEFSAMSRTDMVLLGRACLQLDPALRPSAAELRFKLAQILGTY